MNTPADAYQRCQAASRSELFSYLNSNSEELRYAAARRLQFLPIGELADVWRQKLNDGSPYGREIAAFLMGQPQQEHYSHAEEIRRELACLLHDSNPTVQAAAIAALSHRFAKRHLSRQDFSGSLYAGIAGILHSRNADLHAAVCMGAHAFPGCPLIEQFLIRQLDNPNHETASWALFSLDQHTPPYTNPAIRPALLRLLGNIPAGSPFHHDIIASLVTRCEPAVLPILDALLEQDNIDGHIADALENSTNPAFAQSRRRLEERFANG